MDDPRERDDEQDDERDDEQDEDQQPEGESPEAVSRDMESGLREMQEHADRVDDELQETREDWRRRQQDPAVPGANPDDE